MATINGTLGNDDLTGQGYTSADTYNGLDGNDTLWGGTGNDTLNGDGGDDFLIADSGNTWVNGGLGFDFVSYQQATSGIFVDLAWSGYQTIGSNQGSDYLISIEGVIGSDWNDVLRGDSSNNEIYGQNGDDYLYGRRGSDALLGGNGNDSLYGDSTVPADHYTTTIQDRDGDGYAETIYTAQGNYMAGGMGDDTYYVLNDGFSHEYRDVVTDQLKYVIDQGSITGGDAVVEATGEGTADKVYSGVYDYALTDNVENLELLEGSSVMPSGLVSGRDVRFGYGNTLNNAITGNSTDNDLYGMSGNDTLIGNGGDDILDGGTGNDSMAGGSGSDVYSVDSLSDSVTEAAYGGEIDMVVSSVTWTLGNDVENLLLLDGSAINGTGNLSANELTGNSSANTLTGKDGNDSLYGYDGDDTLLGGAGNDVLDGGAGNNTASYADISAAVTVSLATGNVQITGGAGSDTLILIQNLAGGSGNDSLTGNANNNILTGNGGADTLLGGDGDDTYYLDNSADNVVETAAGGSNDHIYSSAHYTLANRYVESLTLTGSAAINGTGNNMANSLTGNSGANILDAKEGNDTVSAGDGDDTVYGGLGDDILSGGNGINTLTYADMTAAVSVNLNTSLQQNTGGAGLDTITLFSNVTGGSGNDTLIGTGAANRIDGGLGNDSLVGGAGGDTYVVNSLGDIVVEASLVVGEIDTVQSTVTWTLGSNLENLLLNGTAAADGFGNSGHNTLTGNAGANKLSGLDGNDSLLGGDGDDTLLGGLGNDSLNGGNGNNTVSYEGIATAVTVSLQTPGAQATGGAGSDTLTLINNLLGGDGNDSLTGDGTANRLGGGAGVDTLTGGLGNDTYLVAGNGDVIVETSTLATERDTVESSATFTLAAIANVENITLTGTAVINATGNSLANVLTGNAAANVLDGGTGADSMLGGGGNDTYHVDAVGDLITEAGPATDIDTVYSAVTWTLGNNLEILNLTASSSINGTGNALNNTLNGNNGNNVLEGGLGNDSLFGGNGVDTASYLGATAAVNVSLALSNTSQNTGAAGWDYLNLIENLTGSAANDTLTGDGNGNTLRGLNGNDLVAGEGGSDAIYGDGGDDTLLGGEGNDYLSGGSGNDSMHGGGGSADGVSYGDATSAVTIDLNRIDAQITGGSGTDTLVQVEQLFGSGFADRFTGDGNANNLIGEAGNDTLLGGAGADTITGGSGDDSLVGGSEVDLLSYSSAAAAVTVNLLNTSQLTGGAGTDYVTGFENVTGSAYGDALTGDTYNNLLSGLGGDDSLQGGAGNDTLSGGVGADRLDGGTGSNTASYADITAAVSVNLSIVGGQNTGAGGTDTLVLIQNLIGSAYNDTLQGDVQANVLEGGAGNDSLFGADGVDTLNGGAGDDILDGGGNTNTVSYAGTTGNLVVNVGSGLQQNTGAAGLDTLLNMHNIIGGNGNDSLTGGSGDSTLEGGAGNDSLYGGGGINTASYASATAGVNVSLALSNTSQNTGGAGLDWLNQINYLQGSAFNDNLSGDDSWNVLRGGAGNDVLTDGLGNDGLYGEDGNDTLTGGVGDDILHGGNGINTASYLSSSVAVTVSLLTPQGVGQVTGAGTDTLTLIQNLTGGSGNDLLTGNNDANVLNGATGVDSMVGGMGADTYYVDNNDDVITELSSDTSIDLVYSSAAIFNMGGRYVENAIMTGVGNYSVLGNGLANDITGNAGANTIRGGIANDTVRGGLGNDTYEFRRGYDTDVIVENDTTANNTDTVSLIQADVAVDQLWFQHVGNDLQMSIIGTSDKVIIKDWYNTSLNATHVEQFRTFDGQVLLQAQVEALVSAMAGVSATVPTGSTLTVDQQAALAAIIDSSWN